MKVTNGNNPYAYQRQANTKHRGFSDMFENTTANKKQANLDKLSFNMQKVNPHQDHGTQIKPDKEWLNTPGEPNAESKGDKELTGSQILFLQTHYDIENLTPEARHSLLCDLTAMGVLSAADLSSDDQSKVDDALEKIKAFKMGVGTYVEFPDQPEVIVSDGSDPELRGLSDDEKFAAIMKKYGGGTTYDSFHQICYALARDKVITWEQARLLSNIANNDYFEKRRPLEVPGFTMEQGKLFHMNYRVTMGDLLRQATTNKTFYENYYKNNEAFVGEFASKFEALSKTLNTK